MLFRLSGLTNYGDTMLMLKQMGREENFVEL
jgi:hypothetical protein